MSELTSAKQAFLLSTEAYPSAFDPEERSCITALERYLDPKEERDVDIRDRASLAIDALRSIRQTKSDLLSAVSLLLPAANLFSQALAVSKMSSILVEMRSLSPTEFSDASNRFLWAQRIASQCVMSAVEVPSIHINTMRKFQGSFAGMALSHVQALIEVTTDEQRTELLRAIAAAIVPGAAKLIVAAQFLDSVHQKAKALKSAYRGFGAEDKLFAFARELELQQALNREIYLSIGAATDVLTEATFEIQRQSELSHS